VECCPGSEETCSYPVLSWNRLDGIALSGSRMNNHVQIIVSCCLILGQFAVWKEQCFEQREERERRCVQWAVSGYVACSHI
jgi:hypothetical protein